MNSVIHNFEKSEKWSRDLSDECAWVEYYRRIWPDIVAAVRVDVKCDMQYDGIDRIAILPNGKQILIDEKKRKPNEKTGKAFDDFLLEEFSDLHRQTPGWTLDRKKKCDYIAYAITAFSKAYFLPFEVLRITCAHNLRDWRKGRVIDVHNIKGSSTWTTRNWPVPWDTLFAAMRVQMHRQFNGEKLVLPTPVSIGTVQQEFDWGNT